MAVPKTEHEIRDFQRQVMRNHRAGRMAMSELEREVTSFEAWKQRVKAKEETWKKRIETLKKAEKKPSKPAKKSSSQSN